MPRIPLYAYDRSIDEERRTRGADALVGVLRHMLLVREFETMLGEFRAKARYGDVEFVYRGPAHLSVGQEAVAVGLAAALHVDDHIFGNHRSHGEFIAKGLAAIASLEPTQLASRMRTPDTETLVRQARLAIGGHGRTLAENTLLFGLLSEIFMRTTGFNGGMGGSMHAFFPGFGMYPNNAIVGASAGIATGSALWKKRFAPGISVAIAGDGSTGCGPVWEAMNFAAMGQYDTLWPNAQRGGLPVLFVFVNNFYAMGGQTSGETMAWDRLSRIGAGIRADALHAETVDGTDPLAVADAVERQRARLLAGQGPAILDIECYRQSGHSTSDANAYRSQEEIAHWQAHDPIERYSQTLESAGLLSKEDIGKLQAGITEQIRSVAAAATDPTVAAPVDIHQDPLLIGRRMFNHDRIDLPETVLEDLADIDSWKRLQQLDRKSRFGRNSQGDALSPLHAITLRDALFESILHHARHDERLLIWGEECREWGGAFGVYRGLSERLPHDRLFNAPISEAAIVATAVGYAMEGGRALVELMYADFIGRAGDEIFNQLAKWQAMSGGILALPVVLRCSVGSKYGAQHSQDWSSLIAQVPGLKVVYPATPYDAKGLLASALASNDPVVFFESQRLYDQVELFEMAGVPSDYYELPLGVPVRRRAGDAVTVLSIGPMLYPALQAADWLASEHELFIEVIDARCLVPFDPTPIIESVERTGHLVVMTEASERCSWAAHVAALVTRLAFDQLDAAPRILGSPNWIVPGIEMESSYFAQWGDLVDVIATEFGMIDALPALGVRRHELAELSRLGL